MYYGERSRQIIRTPRGNRSDNNMRTRTQLQLALLLVTLVLVTSSVLRRRPYDRYLKGTPPTRHVFRQDVKGPATPQYPRKGEYPCASGICKLKPGEVPAGCEGGECQYPIWR